MTNRQILENLKLPFLSLFFFFFLILLQSLPKFQLLGVKPNLVLVFFILVQGYLDNLPLFFIAAFSGLFFDWMFLTFPFGSLKFLTLFALIAFLKEKVFAKNNFLSLCFFLAVGIIAFNVGAAFNYFLSISFLKELIFNFVLFIIVFLFKSWLG